MSTGPIIINRFLDFGSELVEGSAVVGIVTWWAFVIVVSERLRVAAFGGAPVLSIAVPASLSSSGE